MCVRPATRAVAFLLAVLLAVPSGWAQVSSSDQEAAKAHFLAGSSYYEAANYADAVKEFNEAYRLSKRPDLLYNIALGYERLSDYDNAIATLRRYLVEKVNAPDRNLIEGRIKNLERLRDIRNNPPVAPAPTPAPAPEKSPEPAPARAKLKLHTLGYAGIGAGSLGVVLLLSSVGTGLTAKKKADQLAEDCPTRVNCDPSLRTVQQQGRRMALATDVMLGIGAVALVAGVALLVVDLVRKPKPSAEPTSEPKPEPTPSAPPTTPPPPTAAPGPSVSFTGQGLLLHF